MDNIKKHIRDRYGAVARRPGNPATGTDIGYDAEDLESLPEGAEKGLGCGNPLAFADLRPGETVLDLGSGGGVDCFLAANVVGESGHVIGLDMTDEMIAVARENAERGGYRNVEFRAGEIEDMPVESETVDMVISNCVINLVPDKPRAFSEAFRVLKPGGRLHISDIVLDCEKLPESLMNIEAYAACVSGAVNRTDYLQMMADAGFTKIEIHSERDAAGLLGVSCCGEESSGDGCCADTDMQPLREGSILSVTVSAVKPG
jgi:arsenite methyltransferase